MQRTIQRFVVAFCLFFICAWADAAPVTYPCPAAVDTSGVAVTSGVTDAIVSVTDLDGNAIASPGAAAHIAGGNPSVVYDAATKGEAWITYSLTASGHTFANQTIFCSSDPQTLASTNAVANSTNTKIGTPAGASLSADIAANATALTALPASMWSYRVDGTLTAANALAGTAAVSFGPPTITYIGSSQTTVYPHFGTSNPFVTSVLGRNTVNLPVSKGVTFTP